jgi:hypothetical protein
MAESPTNWISSAALFSGAFAQTGIMKSWCLGEAVRDVLSLREYMVDGIEK